MPAASAHGNFADMYIPNPNYAGGGMSVNEFRRRGLRPHLLRPYLDSKDRPCITVNTGRWTSEKGERVPLRESVTIMEYLNNGGTHFDIYNAVSMPREVWIEIDKAMIKAVRQPLNAWDDLVRRNTFGGFDAYAKMTLEWQAMSDPGEAVVDMDARSDGRNDAPLFDLRSLPLPITHSDFSFGDREAAVMGNMMPWDTTMVEAAGRRIGETVEQTLIGTVTGLTYNTRSSGYLAHTLTSTVYGYTNYTHRITKTDLNTPTGSNPEAVNKDVLEMIDLLQAQGFYGPYVVYNSTNYDQFLNDDYFRSGSTSAVRTLRERIMAIPSIQEVKRLNYLTSGYQLIMVDVGYSELAPRAIVGMPPTTVRWPGKGGLEENFKVMAIMVPQFRSDYYSRCGIVHATTT